MSFDRQFSFFSGAFKIIFVIVIIAIIGSMVFRGSIMYRNHQSGKPTYEITVPAFDGTHQTYITSEYYYDENKCLVFKDEFNIEQHICGQHSITKW